jgi:tRNA dimethylallyltransferase
MDVFTQSVKVRVERKQYLNYKNINLLTNISSNLIVVTGPTATGKTAFAAHLASKLNGEIISADSRQVYRGMDLATGKDIKDYLVNNKIIPYHLVDIIDPGYEYNVFEFQRDFLRIYDDIISRNKMPVLCGGTGMYIESVLKGYRLIDVSENTKLRAQLYRKSDDELVELLESYKVPHNITDTEDRKRLIRSIEIQEYYKNNPELSTSFPEIKSVIFGIYFERKVIRERITSRLKERLEAGMATEVKELLDNGLTPEQLKFYGLEYKYLTQYVTGELNYDEMFKLLNTAIHQFAKRQMTWFRKMERAGYKINWIDGNLEMDEKVSLALEMIH